MEQKDIEFFVKQMESNINKARNAKITLTTFLNEQEQSILVNLSCKDIDILFDGGFENAEIRRAIFLPKEYTQKDFKIKIVEILYNLRYLNLTHRKVLGSLMSLGIKRDSIGDIVFVKDKVYFAVTEEISPYVFQSFKTISGVPIELKEIKEKIQVQKEYRYETHIVSSFRVDCIVASAYKKSRSEVQEMIQNGWISLNHVVCFNGDKQVHLSDVISVRHKGRIYIEEIGGKTRSDRFVIKLGFLV